jgi:hypothetical protein
LKNKVIKLKDKVQILETKNNSTSPPSDSQIIDELLDWQYRSKNILSFNLSENSDQNNLNDVVKTSNLVSEIGANIKPVQLIVHVHLKSTFLKQLMYFLY